MDPLRLLFRLCTDGRIAPAAASEKGFVRGTLVEPNPACGAKATPSATATWASEKGLSLSGPSRRVRNHPSAEVAWSAKGSWLGWWSPPCGIGAGHSICDRPLFAAVALFLACDRSDVATLMPKAAASFATPAPFSSLLAARLASCAAPWPSCAAPSTSRAACFSPPLHLLLAARFLQNQTNRASRARPAKLPTEIPTICPTAIPPDALLD